MTRKEIIEHMKVMADHAAMDDAMLYVMTVKDMDVVKEAAEVLEAQEPVKPILKREGWNKYHNDYVCPVCDQELVYEQNYCSECGKAVKWE